MTLNWCHWTSRKFHQWGFRLPLPRIGDIGLRESPGYGVFDCHCPKIDVTGPPECPDNSVFDCHQPEMITLYIEKFHKMGFRLPLSRIDDTGLWSSPEKEDFDCQLLELMTLDSTKSLQWGFRLPLLRMNDIGPAESHSNGFSTANIGPGDIPPKGFSIAIVPIQWHWNSTLSRQRCFRLPAPQISDIGSRESSPNGVVVCHCPESITSHLEKVPPICFLNDNALNCWYWSLRKNP